MKQYGIEATGNRIIKWICKQIATLGPIGYLPASGTFGTLFAVPLLIGLRYLETYVRFLDEGMIVGFLILLSVWIVNKALIYFDEHDPSEIVLDEVMGFFVVMLFMPLRLTVLVMGFVCFRFFDILKPFGIERFERIGGAWGVVLDDITAAVFARMLMEVMLIVLGR